MRLLEEFLSKKKKKVEVPKKKDKPQVLEVEKRGFEKLSYKPLRVFQNEDNSVQFAITKKRGQYLISKWREDTNRIDEVEFLPEFADALRNIKPRMKMEEELLLEQKDKVTVLVLTKDEDALGETGTTIKEYCEKNNIACYYVYSDLCFIASEEHDENLVIHNHDGSGKKINLTPINTACFVRGSVLDDEAGKTVLRGIENAGVFMINTVHVMELSRNKLLAGFHFEKNNIDTPRTSFINHESSIDNALETIGGKFPVIIKVISGAEGIGVIKINEPEALTATLQAIWKQGGEMLIQEYIPIEYDVRTLVLHGEILGSTKRHKIEGDFRTNLSLGAKTSPYKLSPEEKDLVLKVAKSMNGYLLGIDHVVTKKKNYLVLEVNGSPGSKSNFGDENGKKISREKLIGTIVKTAIDKKTWRGYDTEEHPSVVKVDIELIGEVEARLDTGNESYNALHATDIKKVGDSKVKFKTVNKKVVTAKVVDDKLISVGGDAERRLTISLDLVLDGTKYTNVKFNLADRSENEYPVLIGQKFLKRADVSVKVHK